MKTITHSGQLKLGSWGEGDHVLYLSENDESPLAEILEDEIANKHVSVRYWVSDQQSTKEQAIEGFLKRLYGCANCNVGHAYSEETGYLWTNEQIKVGGHDLINELHSHVGKWLILEIDVHDADPRNQTPPTP